MFTPEQITEIANAIRDTTSDEMSRVIESKSDEELLTLAIHQPGMVRAIAGTIISHFPRRINLLHES